MQPLFFSGRDLGDEHLETMLPTADLVNLAITKDGIFPLKDSMNFDIGVRQNTEDNQAHYDANKPRFNRQCAKVYDLLMSGKRLTVADALVSHGIGHLPRRIADLRAKNIVVNSCWIEVKSGDGYTKVKEYFL